jgi:hypothetical protein
MIRASQPVITVPDNHKSLLNFLPDQPHIISLTPIFGGGNSRIYRVDYDNGQTIAVKQYFSLSDKTNSRQQTEFTALSFLWRHHIWKVPQPKFTDIKHHFAGYAYIEGKPVDIKQVSDGDVTLLSDFITKIDRLTRVDDSRNLPLAKDACFSQRELVKNITNRLVRLRRGSDDKLLQLFLSEEFTPVLRRIIKQSQKVLSDYQIAISDILPFQLRTLSPSDFGFHNSLRQPDGTLAFLDFEYFGWDDPVKLISDFLLHPKNTIKEKFKQQFLSEILALFSRDRNLKPRFAASYPLFALKWCTILLNEFLPAGLSRRTFALPHPIDRKKLLHTQLVKARQMLMIAQKPVRYCIDDIIHVA